MKNFYRFRYLIFILLGVFVLLFKRYYTGPCAELINNHGSNFSVSFAVYFIARLGLRDLPPFPENKILGWIALGTMSLGAVLSLGFMGYLGIKTSIGQGSSAVQQSGPYRWSRNPQIVTYSLVILGFVLLHPSLESTGWAILYGILAHMMVITEEEFLRDSFGIDYQTYCERVPRYISLFR